MHNFPSPHNHVPSLLSPHRYVHSSCKLGKLAALSTAPCCVCSAQQGIQWLSKINITEMHTDLIIVRLGRGCLVVVVVIVFVVFKGWNRGHLEVPYALDCLHSAENDSHEESQENRPKYTD